MPLARRSRAEKVQAQKFTLRPEQFAANGQVSRIAGHAASRDLPVVRPDCRSEAAASPQKPPSDCDRLRT
jgi:hypothetical protein